VHTSSTDVPVQAAVSPVATLAPSFYRVLIAEDALCVRHHMKGILEKLRVNLEMAEDGLMACQMADQSRVDGKPYDLILMDLQMPRMKGLDAIRWLREHDWQGPIIALSAFTENSKNHLASIEAGCNEYVTKPIREEKLQELLMRYLAATASK
jgi:CheY-like chemotaxis protein